MNAFYRKEIDALRAIAILSVILYHIKKSYMPQGFLGVDVFLVISGFLIASITIKEKNFQLFEFLKRRFYRIYPAYFTVICFTIIFGSVICTQETFESIRKSSIYAFLGVANLYFCRNINESYFEISNLQPLLHLWSLSLEIQFYIIWSIILTVSNKIRINIKFLTIIIFIISFFIANYFYYNFSTIHLFGYALAIDKKFVFYLLPGRMWEFSLGILTAMYVKNQKNKAINSTFFIVGILIIMIALFWDKKADEFSPLLSLLICIGTSLFIIFYSENKITSKIFKNKLVVFIGIISYSLYLWHLPIIELIIYFYESLQIIITIIILILASLISYKFVESKYRYVKFPLKFLKYLLCLSSVVITVYIFNRDKIYSNFYKFTSDFEGSCLYHPANDFDVRNNFNIKKCIVGSAAYKPNILVAGSSHSNQFVPFLSVFAKNYGFSFVNITGNSTGYHEEYILDGIYKNDKDRILLHNSLYKLIKSIESNFDILITCPSWSDGHEELFSKTLKEWSHNFKVVILIDPPPIPINFRLKRSWRNNNINFPPNINQVFIKQEIKNYNNVFFISINDLILKNKGLDNENHALFFDSGHLNVGGSIYLAEEIIKDKNPHLLKSLVFLEVAKSRL